MEKITIEYDAIANQNARVGGYLPAIWVNGHFSGNTYADRAHDADRALEIAKAAAEAEAGRYVGDWDVSVSKAGG